MPQVQVIQRFLDELGTLPVAEKLQVIGLLWNEIESSGEALPISAEVWNEIERRSAELESDPGGTIPREELWSRVDARRG
jgi:putative addiction module component (TIGR02574 family)